MRKLTSKQEAYKNNRIQGKSMADSYRQAYPGTNMSRDAIYAEAGKLERKPQIKDAIQAAINEATERAIVSVEEVVRGLLLEATEKGDGSSQSARVAAWRVLTDYTGGFDANKQKVEHSGEIVFNMQFDGE